jgi:hypothetical protein
MNGGFRDLVAGLDPSGFVFNGVADFLDVPPQTSRGVAAAQKRHGQNEHAKNKDEVAEVAGCCLFIP